MNRLALLLAAVTATSVPLAQPRANDFYRHVKDFTQKVKQAVTDVTGDPTVETVPVWRLEGSKPIQLSTRLMDLGIPTHTNFYLDGKLIGGGPYAYWGKFADNTVGDLCAKIQGMAGGYQCRLTSGFNRVGLCIVRDSRLSDPLIFGTYDYDSGGVVTGPAELLGTRPAIRQTNAFAYDYCVVRPDDN